MEKNTKNRIHGMIIPEGLKRFIAGLAAAGITLTSTGCGLNDENVTHIQTPGMAGNSVSDDSRDEKTTTYESGVTGASTNFTTTYTTTVTTGRGFMGSDINTNERKKIGSSSNKDDKNGLSNEDNVNLDNKDDDFIQSEVSSKSSTKVNGTSKTSSRENGTSAKVNTKTTAKTTVKSTEKTTASTTKSTTRPTTKSTTISTTEATTVTETEPQTEPQTEPVIDEPKGFDINDICYSLGAYYSFRSDLLDSITCAYKYEGSNVFVEYDAGYGSSAMGGECYFILYNLNSNFEFDENMLAGFYKKYSVETLMNYKTFIFNLNSIVDYFGGQIDYSKYTIDPNVGNFLNNLDYAYKNGQFDSFMKDQIVDNNIDPNVLNNPGAMAILYSYDKGRYINNDEYNQIDESLNSNINYITNVVNGNRYHM